MSTVNLPLGKLVATPGARDFLAAAGVNPVELLSRHQAGDWGKLSADDIRANEAAVRDGDRVLSSYPIGEDKVWIITEADRSSTCILLPSEY